MFMTKVGKITERTLYPYLKEIISNCGGSGLTEVKFNSEPSKTYYRKIFEKSPTKNLVETSGKIA